METNPVSTGPLSKPKKEGKGYLENDAGNGDRLRDAHGNDLIWCPQAGWMVWKDTRWEPDELQVEVLAERVALRMFAELGDIQDKEDRNRSVHFINSSLDQKGIRDMIRAARRKVRRISLAEFDAKREFLAVRNGVINLRTEQFRQHARTDFTTKVSPVRYDKQAKCPIFHDALKRIVPSLELREYLQRAFGCAATGKPEKVLFILSGTEKGNNGKTVLLEAIRDVLGPFAGQVAIETLITGPRDGGNAAFADIADLCGKRFVTSSEPKDGQFLNEARIKYITGCGQMRGRHLRHEWLDFMPTHKVFLECNRRPRVKNAHSAIWNRVKVIPFEVRLVGSEIDRQLPEKLRRELPGILNWIIEGAELYLESGLGTVPEVDQATESYRMESDVLADFFANRCILGPTVWVGKTELWERYREYMQAIGDRDALDRHEFEAQLLQHDHLKEGVREHGTVRAWIGIAFDSKKVSHRVSMAIGDQR